VQRIKRGLSKKKLFLIELLEDFSAVSAAFLSYLCYGDIAKERGTGSEDHQRA
jgi:hypothetical protein